MTPDDVKKVDADLKLGGRIDRDGWINQARACSLRKTGFILLPLAGEGGPREAGPDEGRSVSR